MPATSLEPTFDAENRPSHRIAPLFAAVHNDNQRAEINTSTVIAWPSGGRTWWAHFAFTRINIELTILEKKIEDLR